jgi:glycosyltransferase involved in cell wall biosynthesis
MQHSTDNNLISIVIPVCNQSQELEKALDSILVQTHKNVEIIIVDDGSVDPVQRSAFSAQRSIPINLIRQENKGAPAARNRGFREAKGEYVIFWDADVVAQPEMLEKMLDSLRKHPEASYSYSDYSFGWKKMPAQKFAPAVLKKRNYIMSTSLIRREDYPESGWDESLKRFQDWDIWLTMLESKKIGVYIPELLFKVIPHKDGISTWLPKFAYKFPFRYLPILRNKVKGFEKSRAIVLSKHNLYKNS